jgi:hypothetical protein
MASIEDPGAGNSLVVQVLTRVLFELSITQVAVMEQKHIDQNKNKICNCGKNNFHLNHSNASMKRKKNLSFASS